MSSYTLSNNAADIDAAISSVVSADATPTDGSQNMVTSGGVKTYVDGTVGVFGGKTITTEATGIGNTDNDTSIPTSAAVKDYVDTEVLTSGKTIQTGWTTLVNGYESAINSAGYTRTNACFVYVECESRVTATYDLVLSIICEGLTFTTRSANIYRLEKDSMTHVVPANTNFKVSVSPAILQGTGSFVRIRVKDFSD